MTQPYVRLVGAHKGFTVFLVDSEWIRNNWDNNFIDYGEPSAFPLFMPPDEIWIDCAKHEAEIGDFAEDCYKAEMRLQAGESVSQETHAQDAPRLTNPNPDAQPKIGRLDQWGALSVWLVNGQIIRNNFSLDFSDGGNSRAYPLFMPANEIWLEDGMHFTDRPFIALHEITEFNEMGDGMLYLPAHKIASRNEIVARTDPSKLDALLQEQIERANLQEH